jgi:hypothetical protein
VDEESRFSGRQNLFDERSDIEDERNALIAQLRGSGEAKRTTEGFAQRLDDDIALPDQFVDDETEPTTGHLGDDHERPPPGVTSRLHPEQSL